MFIKYYRTIKIVKENLHTTNNELTRKILPNSLFLFFFEFSDESFMIMWLCSTFFFIGVIIFLSSIDLCLFF